MAPHQVGRASAGRGALLVYNDASAHSGYSVGLGLASISAHLRRRGTNCTLVYYRSEDQLDDVVRRVAAARPLLIGYYGPASGFAALVRLSSAMRGAVPEAVQVYGGPHATLCPECLLEAPDLDAVCVGYGERPVAELLECLEHGADWVGITGLCSRDSSASGSHLLRNAPSTLQPGGDELFAYDYALFVAELRSFSDFRPATQNLDVVFNRSCPFSCSFCSSEAMRRVLGRSQARPSPSTAVAVIEQGLATTGFRRVEIHDDIFTLDKRWLREFADTYGRRVKAPFWCNLRAGTFDAEDLALLKAAGAELAFLGVESGDEDLRMRVLGKEITDEVLREACRLLNQAGIPVITQNLVGVPGETPAAFLKTVRLNAELAASGAIVSIYHPYPATKLGDECRRRGLVRRDSPTGARERQDTVLELPGFSRRDVRFCKRNLERLVTYERVRRRHPKLMPALTPRRMRFVVSAMRMWHAGRVTVQSLRRAGST